MAYPQASGITLWHQARDAATRFQLITAATPAVADGDVIGTLKDKSASGFDVTAGGNDTTRPLLKILSGVYAVKFDGVNDFLRRASTNLNLFPGSFTVMVAMRSAATATSQCMFGGRYSGNTNDLQKIFGNSSSGRNQEQWRNRAGGNITTSITDSPPGAFDDTPHILALTSDGGTTFKGYLDNVLTFTGSYSTSGVTLAPDAWAYGAFWQSISTINQFANFYLFENVVWSGIVLNSTELTAAYNEILKSLSPPTDPLYIGAGNRASLYIGSRADSAIYLGAKSLF